MATTRPAHPYGREFRDLADRKARMAVAARAAAFRASRHLAQLAGAQDGPGPDTTAERACVGHEDEIQCAGVEQGDVARHHHVPAVTPASPYTMSKKEAWDIYEQRKAYFAKHPPHRATQAECPAGTHPVGETGACA